MSNLKGQWIAPSFIAAVQSMAAAQDRMALEVAPVQQINWPSRDLVVAEVHRAAQSPAGFGVKATERGRWDRLCAEGLTKRQAAAVVHRERMS